jgi:hypothetical protein
MIKQSGMDTIKQTRHCMRCGKKIINPTDLCAQCNLKLQTYMKTHPVYVGPDIERMKAEDQKRYYDFVFEPAMNEVKD